MSTHPDAHGYLKDLARTEALPWFEMICDEACASSTALSASDLSILFQLFVRRASYIKQPVGPTPPASPAGAIPSVTNRLEAIGPFSHFKRLSDTVVAELPKRVTVIFGANGSGKSSLCEALQILASDDAPRRPHRNVHSSAAGTPSFTYRFASDSIPQRWSSPGPYGSRASVIKYFDTGIALSNVRQSVQPGRIVELAPFKLDVFEAAKDHCTNLRSHLLNKQSENQQKLELVTERVRDKFRAFESSELATLTSPTLAVVDAAIQIGSSYVEDGDLGMLCTGNNSEVGRDARAVLVETDAQAVPDLSGWPGPVAAILPLSAHLAAHGRSSPTVINRCRA